MANTQHWQIAYDQLLALISTRRGGTDTWVSPQVIANILLNEPCDPEKVYLAWMLCCFVPWTQPKVATSNSSASKLPKSVAATVAREGIKADGKITKIIQEAVLYLPDVIMTKGEAIDQSDQAGKDSKRKQSSISRELHGKAIRQWGPHWRSTVIFALLVQVSHAQNQSGTSPSMSHRRIPTNSYFKYPERQDLLDSYAAWLSGLMHLDLLNAHQLKPIVNGTQICSALAAEPGPWIKKALDIALAWQLQNPDETSPEGCIEEIIQRKKELDLE